ncbi:MAG: class I SAM-dependent methyltransferase [Candidatus Thorarchaeota archaeon]
MKIFHKISSQVDLPFLETKQIHLRNIFKALKNHFGLINDSKQILIDLGSGNGQVIIYSAINYGIRSVGIEIDPTLIKETKKSVRLIKEEKRQKKKLLHKITLIHGDFYTHNLKSYDFIYIYSLPTMQKYLKHVFQTAKSGSIIISHMYPLKNFTQFLEFKLKLEHNDQNQVNLTFFYRRI